METISIENNNLIPYTYRWNKHLYSFKFCNNDYILISLPHIEMNHSFLYKEDYKEIKWKFYQHKEETSINFYKESINIQHLYNIFIEGRYFITELIKFSNINYNLKKPNENFTYLIALLMNNE